MGNNISAKEAMENCGKAIETFCDATGGPPPQPANDNKKNVLEGQLLISTMIECPHCEYTFNLFRQQELLDDGWLYDLLMPNDKHWSDACQNFSKKYLESFGDDFKCPNCNEILNIGKIWW